MYRIAILCVLCIGLKACSSNSSSEKSTTTDTAPTKAPDAPQLLATEEEEEVTQPEAPQEETAIEQEEREPSTAEDTPGQQENTPTTTPDPNVLPSTVGDYDIVEARCGDSEVSLVGIGTIKFTEAEQMEGLEGYYMFTRFTLENDGVVLHEGILDGAGNFYANCLSGKPGLGAFTFRETTYLLIPRTQGADDLPPINLVLMIRNGEVTTAQTVNTFFDPTNDKLVLGLLKAMLYELQALVGVEIK
ncbi:MAG TPA: hypothetical protein DCE41_13945 [Cytophagales bacterium]|nr:hypothetical protein [Cytophagales bacterium]HAA19413.1 hypothetical protein [Cytophagales bacterium]HAP62267.1 hypothetical protein [Cytophagales bacterium]